MASYTQVFGGETVNPAQLSYISYTITTNLVLVWPQEAPPDAIVSADKIDVATDDPGLSVYLPPANQTSVGNDILIRNVGADTFSVLNASGGALGTVASGEAWYFVLKTNATVAGTWYAIQFGAATSSANAAALAGYGLRANVLQLDQNLSTVPLLTDYSVTVANRASVLQNGTGTATYTFDNAATLGNGFFVYIINAGSGNLTLLPNGAQTIDGGASKVLAPTETAMIFSDGSNLRSLGYGRSVVNTVTGASINIAGAGTYTLSTAEVAAQVQDFSGLLTAARVVDYGAVTGYWFINNNTTGAFSFTARSGGADPGVVVTQGNFTILRSNGSSMEIAFTDAGGTVTSVFTTSDLVGGPITTTGTLGLSNTGAVAGTYGSATVAPVLTVDAKGRTTSISNTTITPAVGSITGLGANVATWLATPSSANLIAAVTDETGTGPLVFGTAPSITNAALTTPSIGVATATSINGVTLTATTGTLTVANGKTLTSSNTLTLAGTDGSTLNVGVGGTLGGYAFLSAAPITNSLAADVVTANTALYYDGPSVAQGVTGTWFASGTVTVADGTAAAQFYVKLWDGTTVIASGVVVSPTGSGQPVTVSLSGYLASPAGNLRISVRNLSYAGTGGMFYNLTGTGKDCTISAYRIA